MIAAIEWVPAGVADPNPKKYEMNAAEKEVIQRLQAQEQEGGQDDNDSDGDAPNKTPILKLPQAANNHLPADLRMDEYSDDEDCDGAAGLGNILIDGNPEESMEEMPEAVKTAMDSNDNDSDDDDEDNDDDEDDLADVPDTREFTPTDVEGLESMNLGGGGLGDVHDMFAEDDDNDSEAEDVKISPDDAMVVVAKTEDDFASLEVHCYDTRTGSLWVHHDIPLPAFPLCLAHGQMTSGDGSSASGNFCAVGTFGPGIEIWNLDVINALEPSCMLGGEDTTLADEVIKDNLMRASSGKKLLKPQRASGGSGEDGIQLRPGSHTEAVMALSWNKVHRHVIASGSADNTVKLWDVSMAGSGNLDKAIAGTYSHHTDKVQSVVWHPVEATILATGSYDRTVALLDARDSAGQNIKKVKVPADCEALAWDPHNPECLTAACEDGTVVTWDVRKFSDKTPLWSMVANEFGGISDITYNNHVPGMFATCSIDKTVALWDTYGENNTPPQPNSIPRTCGTKEMKVGKLYTVSFYPSSPWLLGCGGSENQLALWDMSDEAAIQSRFGSRVEGNQFASSTNKAETNFEAVMAAEKKPPAAPSSSSNKKNKKGKGKNKKVNKRGR